MIKALIWRVSDNTQHYDKAINILERQHDGVEVVDEVSGDEIAKVDKKEHYDVLLVVGARTVGMSSVTKDAAQRKLPVEKLLGDWIICVPGFTLNKYRRLQRSSLSIFAYDCFGGIISNTLGLPFRTPFINLSFGDGKYFVKFLREPHAYLNKKLIEQAATESCNYPIAKLGDIALHMIHYKTFEESVEAWERRKAKINWSNLFVTMVTGDKKTLEEFDALPFKKKACFVPFKSELPSAWYVNPDIDKEARNLAHAVRRFGAGHFVYYDPFDMLLDGKKTPLLDVD